MQPTEGSGEIFVVVIDESYPPTDEGLTEEESEKYRVRLEREFGVTFQDANIGPGADIPAFLTSISTASIPVWTLLFGLFFAGKSIKENLEAWSEIGQTIRRFFSRPIVLARHGAAVLAVEAVFQQMDGVPKSIQLLSYRVGYTGDSDDLKNIDPSTEIHDNPPTLSLGYVVHIFEIEVDQNRFRVGIDGNKTKVVKY